MFTLFMVATLVGLLILAIGAFGERIRDWFYDWLVGPPPSGPHDPW